MKKFQKIRKTWAKAGGGNARVRRFLKRHPEMRTASSVGSAQSKSVSRRDAKSIRRGGELVAMADIQRLRDTPRREIVFQFLPPPPALIDRPASEPRPENAPAHCGCCGGYRAAQRTVVAPTAKKLSFFGRVRAMFRPRHDHRRGQ